MSITIRGAAQEDSPAEVLAYVTGLGGAAITQATVESITRTVYDLSSATPAVAVAEAELVVADVVLDTAESWDLDERGYNFADTVPAAVFAEADHVYRIEYLVTPADGFGEAFVVPVVTPANSTATD